MEYPHEKLANELVQAALTNIRVEVLSEESVIRGDD